VWWADFLIDWLHTFQHCFGSVFDLGVREPSVVGNILFIAGGFTRLSSSSRWILGGGIFEEEGSGGLRSESRLETFGIWRGGWCF
jgi:hypothetical protein